MSRSHFSIPEHCFVAKQLDKTLFCCNTSKHGIFCRKLLKYALTAQKMAASALRADSTFSLTLPRPHLIILYHIVCKNIAYFQIIFPVGLPSWSTRASMIKYRVKLLCNFRQCFHVVQISSQVGQIERWGQFFICAAGRWRGRAGGHR